MIYSSKLLSSFGAIGSSIKAGLLLYISADYIFKGRMLHTAQKKTFNWIDDFFINLIRFLIGYACLFFGIYFLIQLPRYRVDHKPTQVLVDWVKFIHLFAFVSIATQLFFLTATLQQTKIFRHMVLHTLLWLKGHIPFGLSRFLKKMKTPNQRSLTGSEK